MPSSPTTDVLVVAAHPPELSGLTSLLGEGLRAEIEGRLVLGVAVGIGLVAAAAGMGARLASAKPSCVIVTGTCGVYAPYAHAIPVGSVIVGRKLCLASIAVIEGRGAVPPPMDTALIADDGLSSALSTSGGKKAGVATTLAITTDDDLADRIATTTGCEVEHLEAFAVASACATFGVPVAVVLGVANQVGKGAREEWRKNHEWAGRAATETISTWIRQAGRAGA